METTPQSIDRLSSLPDGVICHILSFLPIKLTVSTSILATRWRFLWAHVSNLDFGRENRFKLKGLSNTINTVMSLYQTPSMNTFRLYHKGVCREGDFKTWISNVIARNVEKLDICLDYQLMFRECFFTCKTLVDLKLNHCWNISMSDTVYFPALKKLHLSSILYECDESLQHMISGCPVLEELIIERSNPHISCCYISSPTLTRFTILSRLCTVDKYHVKTKTLKMDTPALKYLQVEDSIAENVSTGPLTSLIEADINFDYKQRSKSNLPYCRSVLEFVGGLCNVTCLKLSSSLLSQRYSVSCAPAVKFYNLIKLELAADYRFISYFLENADNLEVLIIREVNYDLGCWMEPRQLPACLSHLRTVTIHQSESGERESAVMSYLLKNAKVLKIMEIDSQYCGKGLKRKLDALKRISKFQRGSETCEVVFN